jgi:uncharacterized protein YjbI with pentapeptide repeats
MSAQEHLKILEKGPQYWNKWRKEYSEIYPVLRELDLSGMQLEEVDLSRADLRKTNLTGANLNGANLDEANLENAILIRARVKEANLRKANLRGALLTEANFKNVNLIGADLTEAKLFSTKLSEAKLSNAILRKANLMGANLMNANLTEANLQGACLSRTLLKQALFVFAQLQDADLTEADLSKADFRNTDLSRAKLTSAVLNQTNFEKAILKNCNIYRVTLRDLKLQGAKQARLVLTPSHQPSIIVDHFEVAQFVELFMSNNKFQKIIRKISSSFAILFGSFANPEHLPLLNSIKYGLKKKGYTPLIFSFHQASNEYIEANIKALSMLTPFIIMDLTHSEHFPNPFSKLLRSSSKIQPLLQKGKAPPSLYQQLKKEFTVLPIIAYQHLGQLDKSFGESFILSVEERMKS